MLNKKTLAVMKRELREKLFSRSFILMTVLIPVFMFGILALQTFFLSFSGEGNVRLQIISSSPEITEKVKSEFEKGSLMKDKSYKIEFQTMERSELSNYLDKIKSEVVSEKLTGVVYIPQESLKEKKVEYYSKTPNNQKVQDKLKSAINKAISSIYFSGRGFTASDITFASENVGFQAFKVSKDNKIEEAGYGNQVLSFLFSFLLYFSLIFTGSIMMRSVVQEKNNRIVEVLLSSVESKELMTGKILGSSITALFQMAIWLSPLMVLISTSWFILPPKLVLSISAMQLIYFLINYFVGLLIFMGLFAAVGAIFDNEQDTQSGMWPVMMLIMIPFFISLSLQTNPGSPLVKVASIFPVASIIVMPARMAVTEVPWVEVAISFFLNISAMSFVFLLAGKIYRVGILMTGKKPKWSEIVQWVKYKY
ncbi:MAG: ABC transporter permease [Ignavibacteria bacterium]|jgi:ABC-2 type transport system permease protein|nr:ABC transporter permease [Ignavibacteria bacterium]MCU7504005.1 ABC transporter permease [Ignavibacteria bacterium]MCU7515377.1 ABC transporter permease [Ignavibacteria bacterium]